MNGFFPYSVLNELERDLGRRQAVMNGRIKARNWQPAVDVVENDEAWLLTMDVPGINREAIEITVEKQLLTVKAERTIDYGDNRTTLRERDAGSFSRQFQLPDTVDAEAIVAKVENGVLALELPKRAKAEPRRITVQ